jgi:hypothetical protein
MADINYWGLTGTKRSVTGITLATATVDTLITAIATDEGLPADYYHWSLLSDPSKNSITFGDSSTKLSAIGLVDGDTVSCTPQQNESKQERQIRKLTIAEAKRKAFGDTTKPYYRVANTLDITLLPDTYATTGDDNANSGGLVEGRPWTSTPPIITAGLVLHLDSGDTDSYPGTGTTWYDLSPSGKNATLGNAVYYNPADGGQLTFTGGSNGIATITSASAITGLTNNMTIEAWYNSDSVRLPRILSTGAGSDGICFGVFSSTITKWKVSKYGQVDLYVGSVPQDVNKWHQVVLVYSSTAGTKIYIDGVLSETNADTTVIQGSATPTITIGALESLYHKGGISIVRWYNTVLSDADILQNYNANIGRYKNPARVANILIYFDPSNRNTKTANDFLRSLGELSFTASTVNATWAGSPSPYLTYNGTNAYATLADGSGYEPGSNNFSIEVWVYWDATTGASRCIVSKTDNGGLASNWSYGIRTSSAGEVYFEVGNGTTSIQTAGYAVNPGQWYQVVGVWTNIATNAIELYVNGARQSTGSHAFASVKNSTNPLYLGTYNGGEYSQWFGGRIGVYRHYNIALSSAEVLQNYENDRGLYGI